MTAYRRFGSKAALIDALAVRECRRCLATIAQALDPQASFLDRAVSLFITVLMVIREHPLLARLARGEPEAFLMELTWDGSAIFLMVRGFLVRVVEDRQRRREQLPGDPALLAETRRVVRADAGQRAAPGGRAGRPGSGARTA